MPWTIERQEHVAVVGMSSHKVNIQNERFFTDLDAAFDRLEREFADCAVVLCSEGKSFSAGLDFAEAFALMQGGDRQALEAWAKRYIATNMRVWQYPRPTVAAIHGAAIAGGLITAFDCDFRVASDDARLGLNEVPIGIAFPAAYVEIVRAAIGSPLAARLMLLGQIYEAKDAAGIVHYVVPRDELLPRAIALAKSVPPQAYGAYAHTKRALQAPILQRIARDAAALDAALLDVLRAPEAAAQRAERDAAVRGDK